MNLRILNNAPQLPLLILTQVHIPRRKVPLQSRDLCRARNSNHALRRDPRQRNLTDSAALTVRELLDLLHDGFIVVEVLALEFGGCSAEVVGGEVVRGLDVGVVYEPPMPQWTVGNVGNA